MYWNKRFLLIIALLFVVFGNVLAQSPYRIRLADSTYAAQLRGVTGTRTAGITITGTYKSNFRAHQFNVTTTGRYDLYIDATGTGSSYSKDAIWSGSVGKSVIGKTDLERTVSLGVYADPDSNAQMDTQAYEDGSVTLVKLADEVLAYVATGGDFNSDSLRNMVGDSVAALSADGVTITNSGGTFRQVVFADTAALKAVAGSAGNRVVLKQLASGDADGGGQFIWKTSGYAAKPGAVYPASGGAWVRKEYAVDTTYFELDWIGARTDTEVETAIKRMADGSTIVFGEGFYTGDINLNGATAPDSLTFRGQGIFRTISTGGMQALDFQGLTIQDMSFLRTASGDVMQFGASTNDSTFVIDLTLRNLMLGGSGKSTTDHLILAQRGGKCSFENIQGYGGSNLIAARARDLYFNNIIGSSDINYVITAKASDATGLDDGNNARLRVSNISVPTGSVGVFVHGAGGYTFSEGTITNVVGEPGSKSPVTIWTDGTTDGYVKNITVSNSIGRDVSGNGFVNYGGDNIIFANCIIDSCSGDAFTTVNNTLGAPTREYGYGLIARKVGNNIWSGSWSHIQVNDTTYVNNGKQILGPVNFATEIYTNFPERQVLRGSSLGSTQGNLVPISEVRGLVSSNLGVVTGLYRHHSGGAYNTASIRDWLAVDGTGRDASQVWRELGFNSAFQSYWATGKGGTEWMSIYNGLVNIGGRLTPGNVPSLVSVAHANPVVTITDPDINLHTVGVTEGADSAAIQFDARTQVGHSVPTFSMSDGVGNKMTLSPEFQTSITPADSTNIKIVINGVTYWIRVRRE